MPKKLRNYLKNKLKGIDLTEIADILLFGSAVKGKEFPADADICIIFRKKANPLLLNEISSRLEGINAHISSLTIDNFFRNPHSLSRAILVEGESILTGKKLAKNLGFSSVFIYSYELSNLKPSGKVRFVYLLKGRKGEMGIIKKNGGEWLADSCFIVPSENDNDISNIFKKWRVEYRKKEALIH
ncbi:nucleotidyltransferase domain-containing protein [Candidatus Pacearchaeota archaeon]|nr:nucleotidyltransferase domain-containing protein [Candidatus Pacearchaeota archaeon]